LPEEFYNSFSATGGAIGAVMLATPVGPALPLFAKGVIEPVSEIAARLAAKAPEALVAYIAAASMGAYSQAQEAEADRLGLIIMNKAGFNPAAAKSVIEKFIGAWHTR
jgi:Zn-dependent protease with chaperone function